MIVKNINNFDFERQKMKNKCNENKSCRLNKVGGQAVLEGVMMKAGSRTVTTCRKEDGSIFQSDGEFVSIRKKHKWLNIPILRGVVNFIEMLVLSMKTLGASAEAFGLDEEPEKEGKCTKWLKKHLGISTTDLVMALSLILGIGLALLLFIYLPILTADLFNLIFDYKLGAWRAVIEGAAKVVIFITYLSLVALVPDIKRTFMYHGAEHKTISCFEAGEELTPENAKKHTRFHPRCGTSFMFFMIILGIAVGFFIRFIFPNLPNWAYYVIRPLMLPLLMGIGYEFIMFAGKHDNFITRFFSAPGLWVQRITTKEPTLDMLEIAIISAKCALRDEIPEFREFFEAKSWESKPENEEISESNPHADENSQENQAENPHSEEANASAEASAPHIEEKSADNTEAIPHATEDGAQTADIKSAEVEEI